MLGRTPSIAITPDDPQVTGITLANLDVSAETTSISRRPPQQNRTENLLAGADPADKAAVYEEMGIDVTYHQDGRILVESRPRVVSVGVGGGT